MVLSAYIIYMYFIEAASSLHMINPQYFVRDEFVQPFIRSFACC